MIISVPKEIKDQERRVGITPTGVATLASDGHCLLVERDSKLIGIMTERDILLKITGKGMNFDKEIVDDFMTANPEYLQMEDAVAYALNKMVVSGFRHVPIVDDNKKSVGVVSLVDIVQQVATSLGEEILNLPPIPQRKGFARPEGG